MNGLRLALTTLTVLPLRAGRVDRRAARTAMSVAPLVGLLLGAVLAGLLWLLDSAPPLVAGGVTVAVAVLLTRGLHLDGLADTVDALGSYRRGADALDIMKKPDIGPFGVAAVALTLLVQAAALTPVAAVVAWTAGRAALPLACRRGVPPARPDGLGAMVAGTVPAPLAVGIAIAVAGAAWWAVPGRPWQGPAAVAAALLVVVLLLRHAVRRFGGITGDVLGACVELATTVTLVGLAL
ncbi:adenosylcobinamide-GDP ribazoletransferase [Actinoplanes sp. NPDC051470]|uniref:adenosylcobinamide-GDP ribazoletransferase n=1 Tax=unclassified Actinoplanes TaxID=2626549 RepID=UPI0034184523